MKFITASSLMLCLLLFNQAYAQFDGQNGQPSFHSEVEEDNRPNFLKVEEESMLIARWQEALSVLGLNNVATLQETQLNDLEQEIRSTLNELERQNQQVVQYINQLETRNEQLEQLQSSMATMLVDLEEENELFNGMGANITEEESEVVADNQAEIELLSTELANYQQEYSQNQSDLISQNELLLDNESQLDIVIDQGEALQIVMSNLEQIKEMMTFAMHVAR